MTTAVRATECAGDLEQNGRVNGTVATTADTVRKESVAQMKIIVTIQIAQTTTTVDTVTTAKMVLRSEDYENGS